MNIVETEFNSRMLNAINSECFNNLLEAFDIACKKYAKNNAFSCMGSSLSYSQIDDLSGRVASYLMALDGVAVGDRVVLQLPNINQFPVIAWGVLRAGLVLVNANPLYTTRELRHIVEDSGAKLFFGIENIIEQIIPAVENTSVLKIVSTDIFDMNTVPSELPNSAVDLVSLSQILADTEQQENGKYVSRSFNDLALIQYTGGTTGEPKGAMLTQGNIYASAMLSSTALGEEDSEDLVIAPMPLYHIYGFAVNVVGNFLRGGCSVLIPDPRNTDDLISTMASVPFVSFTGVNTIFVSLINHPKFPDVDFSHCKGVIAGGAALVPDVATRWKSITGTDIYEGYGLTETCAILSCNAIERNRLGTVGQPLPYQEVKIIDLDGNALATGAEGEVIVRGPQVMVGYWNRPEATRACLDGEGWLSTGDIGYIDEEGYLRIVDRLKDMILVSGFNVYPNEVEAVLYENPAIEEAAVIGVPDEKSGEAVKAFISFRGDSQSPEDIKAYCKTKLAAYKVPKLIEVRDSLPKSNVGKILRKELRSES